MDGLIYREADNANTVLLIHSNDGDGSQTFTDSKNARTITPVGDVKHSASKKKFGASSIYFDGNDYLRLDDNADWDAGSGTFTIDFWINFDDVAAEQGICGHYSAIDLCWGIYWGGGAIRWKNVNGGLSESFEYAWSPSANTWYHVAFIRGWGGVANKFSWCIDGTSIADSTFTSNMATTNTGYLKIGFYTIDEVPAVFDHCYLRGYIDEFRMVKGAAAWTADFTPPKGMYV